jgi:thiol-disulfide isomerase/thioredoxin
MIAASLLTALWVGALPADPIAWIHDDWAKAKKTASSEGKLIAVDVWATWCHTCLSMKNYTLREKPLARVAGTHTWLALDYDRPANAAFFEAFPITAFPTFLVVDPKTDKVVARWLGSGTAEQMARFFAEASKTADDPVSLGQRALAQKDWPAALAIFDKALPAARSPAERTRILAGWIEAAWKHDPKRCATEGLAHVDTVDDTAPGIDYAAMVLYCAESLDEKTQKTIAARVRDRLERAAKNPSLLLSVDDRSSLLGTLVDAYDLLGQEARAKATLTAQLELLESAAASAPSAEARATFDAHRLGGYLRLERWDDAEKMLKASEAALPHDFNPPWRLSTVYRKKGEPAAALAAIDRALARGYGPRKIRLYSAKIDVLLAAGRVGEAETALTAGRAEIDAIGRGLIRTSWIEELETKAKAITEATPRTAAR